MGQFTKKLVSTVVTLSTVLSSVGVGAFAIPSVASADTLTNGDLIKASGPAVYYFFNNRRYVFPNEATYKSWFPDFSGVRTISDADLAAVTLIGGGNLTIRPGTKLVKITTDPKVYAVTSGGQLHWVETEAIATALYGSSWASRVVDVADGFFNNYSVGEPIATAVHPDGSLISYAGSSDVFIVEGGVRRHVTAAGISANMFQAGNVVQTSVSYPMGTDVTAREAALADAVVGGSSSTPGVTGSLSVSLASDTPAAMVLPKNASSVMFTKVNLTANGAAHVTGVKFHRVGVGSTSDFSNLYLYAADGTRLTSGRTISASTNIVEFNGLNINIAAGATASVYLSADLSSPSTTGGQHAFELADASSIVMDGTGSVGGSFPVRGNAMTVGTASAARVDVLNGATPANPRVGSTDVEIANFRLQANGSDDVTIRRVTLYQAGDISNSDLSNLVLFQGGVQVAAVSSVQNDGKIVLNFATPFLIPNGQSRTFNLHGSVTGRSGRAIRVYAEYASDVFAVDNVYGVGAQVCTDSAVSPCAGTYDGSGSGSTNASYSTTQGGQFTITYNGPATANVGKGQNDAVFYRFAITSGSNDIEIRKFNFAVTSTGSGIYDGTTEYLRDIKIKDADTGEIVAGPVSCATACPGYHAFSTSVSVTMHAGQTRNFVITADTSNSISGGSTYQFALGGASGDAIFGSTDLRVVSSGEFLTTGIAPNTTVTGNTMTVLAASLNVNLAGTPSANTYVKNQANIPAVGLTLAAGSQSDVHVTSLKVTGKGNVAGTFLAAQLHNVVNSCSLFDGGTQIGTSQSPDATTGAMTFTGISLVVTAGSSKNLEVRCTSDSSVAQTGGDSFSIGMTSNSDISAQDTDGNTVTANSLVSTITANATDGFTPTIAQTVRANGSLTVASSNQRSSTILVADGSTWNVMARYRADAQYEDMNIDYIGVTSTGPSANFTSGLVSGSDVQGGVAVVQSSDANCATYSVRGSTSLPSGVSQAAEVDMHSNPIVVPKGSSTYICLLGRLQQTNTSSSVDATVAPRSGNTVALGIPAGALTVAGAASTVFTSALFSSNLDVRATGAASGERVYQTSASNILGNSFVVRKAKPVVTNLFTGLSNTLSGGQKSLYRAQIGSEGGEVAIKQLTFKVSVVTTSAMTLSNFRLQRDGADINTSDVSIQDQYGSNLGSGTLAVVTGTSTFAVIVRFVNEETVSGSGHSYTLNATVNGLGSTTGDSIVTNLLQNSGLSAITGYLSQDASQLTGDNVYAGKVGIATSVAPSTATTGIAYAMIWSDKSEQPHYSNVFTGSELASRDWTNEYLVDTSITQSMVMSK